MRIGKASSVFGRLLNIWKSKRISMPVKVKLYESLVISTLLYVAELWPLPVTQMKKLEAAHHKFQRRLLGIMWKDKVRNEEIRRKTGLQKLELIIRERRLRWLGHVLRMDDSRSMVLLTVCRHGPVTQIVAIYRSATQMVNYRATDQCRPNVSDRLTTTKVLDKDQFCNI